MSGITEMSDIDLGTSMIEVPAYIMVKEPTMDRVQVTVGGSLLPFVTEYIGVLPSMYTATYENRGVIKDGKTIFALIGVRHE